jgi:hypothetical protein
VFQMDVAKVDRDVAYVAMVVHVCCNGLLPMFHLDVAYVSDIYCLCFIWILRMVAMVFKCF